jgi:hypothetical protein
MKQIAEMSCEPMLIVPAAYFFVQGMRLCMSGQQLHMPPACQVSFMLPCICYHVQLPLLIPAGPSARLADLRQDYFGW